MELHLQEDWPSSALPEGGPGTRAAAAAVTWWPHTSSPTMLWIRLDIVLLADPWSVGNFYRKTIIHASPLTFVEVCERLSTAVDTI